jgi:hypothetical protein
MMGRLSNAEIDRLRELYEERAAIKEFLGNMPRAQAEAEARKEVYGPKRECAIISEKGEL